MKRRMQCVLIEWFQVGFLSIQSLLFLFAIFCHFIAKNIYYSCGWLCCYYKGIELWQTFCHNYFGFNMHYGYKTMTRTNLLYTCRRAGAVWEEASFSPSTLKTPGPRPCSAWETKLGAYTFHRKLYWVKYFDDNIY